MYASTCECKFINLNLHFSQSLTYIAKSAHPQNKTLSHARAHNNSEHHVTKARTLGKLVLVDLAGSERIERSGVKGSRLAEVDTHPGGD